MNDLLRMQRVTVIRKGYSITWWQAMAIDRLCIDQGQVIPFAYQIWGKNPDLAVTIGRWKYTIARNGNRWLI